MTKILAVASDKVRFYDNVTDYLWIEAGLIRFTDALGNTVSISGCPIFVTETPEESE